MATHAGKPGSSGRRALLTLSLGALGVVYGDIGTSPLYALKECFNGPHGVAPAPENVMGVLSLVFWAMTFVVTFKYLSLVMRADNRGEGGILALMALVGEREATRRGRHTLLILGLFGAALLYGDGVITPAISVLGAVEGVAVAAPTLGHVVVPITLVILVGLFLIQKRGTAAVGAVFGPVMLIWFTCIALLGLHGIAQDPSILAAASPHHAVRFFARHHLQGFLVLGAVVLVITGGEALYADMGHFGRRPIRLAWLAIAMPALLLNYFGQGAMLLRDPAAARNPFYLLTPTWALYPMIGIATAAAIVASQALISGAFSLTNQAVQLGYSPRVTIRHTSKTEAGQIYIPEVNWALGVATVMLVLGFKSSSNLAAAYGIAVTGTMMITTILFHRVARDRWHWPRSRTWPLSTLLLAVDVAFFSANFVKIEEGGWFPLAAAAGVFALMSTWKRGREVLRAQLQGAGLPLELFIHDLERHPPLRVPGTAIFMASDPGGVPPVLLHHLKHNKVLHERVLFVSVLTEEIPAVPDAERISVKVLGGETLLPNGSSRLAGWRKRLFIVMSRNAQPASAFFGLPPNRVVEMGAQIQL